MKGSASLLGLTVGDYFNLCNWQLSQPKRNNLPKQAKKVVSPQRPSVVAALSVKEFFNSCNWQLLSQPLLDDEITSSLPLSPDLPSNLPCLTVTEFLSLCNWQLLPQEVRPSQSLPVSAPAPASPLTMQVQAFFLTIPWGGSHEISESPQISGLSKLNFPAPKEMNANDLSKLF